MTAVKYEAKGRDDEVDDFTLLEPLEKHGISNRCAIILAKEVDFSSSSILVYCEIFVFLVPYSFSYFNESNLLFSRVHLNMYVNKWLYKNCV